MSPSRRTTGCSITAVIALALLGAPVDLGVDAAAPTTSHVGEIIGYSVQGRPIEAYTVGWGARMLVFVGAIHGGSEWATADLVAKAAEYFRLRAADVPPALSLVFIPSANPDGLAAGHRRAARFNMRQVDLNRNWDCAWRPSSKWNGMTVSGGSAPFSEPETRALRNYLLDLRPALVVLYHSRAGTVGAGVCTESLAASVEVARLVARTTGYAFSALPFYEVSGDAAGYLNQEGIPSIEIELWTHSNVDWEINLAGMIAMMTWAGDDAR